jgi:hypothetical protein
VSRLLDVDAVTEVLEKAFRPLMHTVSVSSDKQNVSLIIFDSNGAQIMRAPSRPGLEIRDPYSLRLTIERMRSQLRMKGFRIDPWQPPR